MINEMKFTEVSRKEFVRWYKKFKIDQNFYFLSLIRFACNVISYENKHVKIDWKTQVCPTIYIKSKMHFLIKRKENQGEKMYKTSMWFVNIYFHYLEKRRNKNCSLINNYKMKVSGILFLFYVLKVTYF